MGETIKNILTRSDLGQKINVENLILQENESDSAKDKKNVFLRMQISNINHIKRMHYVLDEDTKKQLEQLENEISTIKKLELIEKLIFTFEEKEKQLQKKLNDTVNSLISEVKKNDDYEFHLNEKNIKSILSEQKYENFKLSIDYYNESIKRIRKLLKSLYALKKLQKSFLMREEKLLERKNGDIFIENTFDIIDKVLDNSNMAVELKKTIKKEAAAFLNYIDTYKLEKDFIPLEEYTNFFISAFQKMDKEDVICLCNIFKNSLKHKCYELKSLHVDTSLPRKKLKQLMKYFNDKKEDMLNEIIEDKTDYVDIFISLLDDELNYYYFKRILEEIKYELNVSSIKELLETIIDCLIVNYKYKLANQKFDYIDPKYYESLLILFIDNNLLTIECKDILMTRLNSFKDYLCGKEERLSQSKIDALKDIEDLITKVNGSVEYKNKDLLLKEKIESLMREKMPYIVENYQKLGFSSGDKQKYMDYTFSTFVFGNYAYSKRYNDEGDFFFQIHILDTSSFITEVECIDDRLKESLFSKENILFQYKEGKKYPVMTFQFRIYQNNAVSKMKVFSNIIEVDSIYSMDDLINYRNNVDLKALISAHKRIGSFCLESFDIDQSTENLLSDSIIEFLNGFEKEVPMMYRRISSEAFEDLNVRNHNKICHYLSKIPKKQAHKIFYILDEIPEKFYTNYQTSDAYVSLDSFSYSGIYLLRTIKKIIKNEYCFHGEEYAKEKDRVISCCKTLNKHYGYVPNKIMKQDKIKNIDKK